MGATGRGGGSPPRFQAHHVYTDAHTDTRVRRCLHTRTQTRAHTRRPTQAGFLDASWPCPPAGQPRTWGHTRGTSGLGGLSRDCPSVGDPKGQVWKEPILAGGQARGRAPGRRPSCVSCRSRPETTGPGAGGGSGRVAGSQQRPVWLGQSQQDTGWATGQKPRLGLTCLGRFSSSRTLSQTHLLIRECKTLRRRWRSGRDISPVLPPPCLAPAESQQV